MLIVHHQKPSLRWIWIPCLIACIGWLLLPAQSLAKTGTIGDHANVLNTSTVEQATESLSYTVDIFTTDTFVDSTSAFDQEIKNLASSYDPSMSACDQVMDVGCELYSTEGSSSIYTYSERKGDASTSIEIGIDVTSRHIAIESGESVKLDSDLYQKAIDSFGETMHKTKDDYTQSTVAALSTLQNQGNLFGGSAKILPYILVGLLVVGGIIYSMVFGNSGNSSGSGYRRRYNGYRGGGGGGGGGSSSGGGGGGGASGSF